MGKNTEISERISEMIESLDSNPNSFAKALGYSRAQTIYDIVNGKSAPSYDFFKRFQISEFSDIINIDWLLTGRGNKLNISNLNNKNGKVNGKVNGKESPNNTNQALAKTEHIEIKLPNPLDNEEETCVPFYDLPVSAGSLGILDSEGSEIPVPKGYVQLSVFRGCEYIFPVIGISMEPLIYSGDWIGIRHIDNISRSWDFIQTGVIYLIITHEDRMIKFIEQSSDNDDYIVCTSPNYKSFKVYKGDIINIYRVKAFARGI